MLTEEDFTFLSHSHEQKQWAIPEQMSLDELTNQAITATLNRTHGNIKEAAAILGIDRSTLYDRLKKYNLPRN